MGTIVSKSDPDAALGVAVDAAQDEDRAAVAGKRSSRFALFEIVSKKRDAQSAVAMEKLRDCADSCASVTFLVPWVMVGLFLRCGG